jgi:hypothetical protein
MSQWIIGVMGNEAMSCLFMTSLPSPRRPIDSYNDGLKYGLRRDDSQDIEGSGPDVYGMVFTEDRPVVNSTAKGQ